MRRRIVLLLMVSVVQGLLGCEDGSQSMSMDVGSTGDKLLYDNDPDDIKWYDAPYNNLVELCWDTSGWETEKAWMEDAAHATWPAYSGLSLSFHPDCTGLSSSVVHLTIFDAYNGTPYVCPYTWGRSYHWFGPEIEIYLSHPEEGCNERTRKTNANFIIVHELGHILGYSHEQQRDDFEDTDCVLTPGDSNNEVDTDGTKVTGRDDDSIMNYCRPHPMNGTRDVLSALDKAGVQAIYGFPARTEISGANFCNASSDQLLIGDVNGDGREDLVCRQSAGSLKVDLADGKGEFHGVDYTNTLGYCTGASDRLMIGNVNASDRRADLICRQSNGLLAVDYATSTVGFQTADWSASTSFCGASGAVLLTGDINGDKRTDLICNEGGAVKVDLATGGGSPFGTVDSTSSTGFCSGAADRLFVGDFDEDDKADLLCNRADGELLVDLGGVGGIAGADRQSARDFCQGSDDRLNVTDINGDAHDDILCINNQTGYVVADFAADTDLFTGDDWQGAFGAWCKGGAALYTGNFDGPRGRDDLLCIEPGGTLKTQLSILVRDDLEQFGDVHFWNFGFPDGDDIVLAGDFNGDQRDDLARFTRESTGDVFVALSTGTSFVDAGKWHDMFSVSLEIPKVGDFNGDGLDDLVTFVRDTKTGAGVGDVWVTLSTGTSFSASSAWHGDLCRGGELPEIGDVNGDGLDDVVVFVRDARTGAEQGDVLVALSDGTKFLGPVKWHDWFSVGNEVPAVGDINGDGMGDVLTVAPDPLGGSANITWTALSTGSSFGVSEIWNSAFPYGTMNVRVADFNDDGAADLGSFPQPGSAFTMHVSVSQFYQFDNDWSWIDGFGDPDRQGTMPQVLVADVNRDTRPDLIAIRPSEDRVEVTLGGAPQNPAVCGDGILQEAEECEDGNLVNGDGCNAYCRWEPICDPEDIVDLGPPGVDVNVSIFGCYKIEDDLPAGWGTRPMKFIAAEEWDHAYPAIVMWNNTCSGSSGIGTLEAFEDSEIFNVTSDACPTYVTLTGPYNNSFKVRYEPVGALDDCTASSAVDMGVPGTSVTVPVNGCLKITQYPYWWDKRQMQLQNMTGGPYPVPFTWSNPCGGSTGSSGINADWQSFYINNISENCTTLINLNGSGTGNLTMRYYAM